MRLTHNHVLFWESKQKRPNWVRELENSDDARVRRMQFIHACINDHDERYSNHLFAYRLRYSQCSNTIVLLKSARRRKEDLEKYLVYLAAIHREPNLHQNNAKRWLRRLYRAERKIQLTPEGTVK